MRGTLDNPFWVIEMLREDCERIGMCNVSDAKDGHWHMWTRQFRSIRSDLWSLTECIEAWHSYIQDVASTTSGYNFQPEMHRIRNSITGETIPCAIL